MQPVALDEQLADLRSRPIISASTSTEPAGSTSSTAGCGTNFLDRACGPARGQHPQPSLADPAQREPERVHGGEVEPGQVVDDDQRGTEPAQDREQARGDLARPGRRPGRLPAERDVQRDPLRLGQVHEHILADLLEQFDEAAERALPACLAAVHGEGTEALLLSDADPGLEKGRLADTGFSGDQDGMQARGRVFDELCDSAQFLGTTVNRGRRPHTISSIHIASMAARPDILRGFSARRALLTVDTRPGNASGARGGVVDVDGDAHHGQCYLAHWIHLYILPE